MGSSAHWYPRSLKWWVNGKALDICLTYHWALAYNWYQTPKWNILDGLRRQWPR
jgi:hypothetical protein